MVKWCKLAVPHILNLAVLLAIAWLLFFFKLANVPFYERGEPREGIVVVEMHSSENFILPLVNGEYIPFKPPLFHWLAFLAGKLLGQIDEFSLRLPSAVFATLGVLLTYVAGARLWSERAGFVAGVILLSNIQWWNGATIVQVDMTLTFFLTASLIAFFPIYRNPVVTRWKTYGLAVLLACATLAKGPLGVILPLWVIGVFLAIRGDFACLKRFYPWSSAALYLLFAGSWYTLALWQGGEPFFFRQIIDETLGTASGEIGHAQSLYYYLPIFFANFSPWTFFALPLILSRTRLKSARSVEVLYLLVWIVSAFALFSLSSGKRPIYILCLYPPAALLWAKGWVDLEADRSSSHQLTILIGYFTAAVYLIAVSIYWLSLAGWHLPRYLTKSQTLDFIVGLLLQPSTFLHLGFFAAMLVILALFWSLWRKHLEYVFSAFAALAIFSIIVVKTVFTPAVAAQLSYKPFIERVRQIVDAEAPLYFFHAFDSGAIFYAHRHLPSYQEFEPTITPPFYLLMWEEEWARLNHTDGLTVMAKSDGTGPARLHRMVLVMAKEKTFLDTAY